MHHNVTVSVVSVLRQPKKMSMDMNEKMVYRQFMLVFAVQMARLPCHEGIPRLNRRPCFPRPLQRSRGHNQQAPHRGRNLTYGATGAYSAALASCFHELERPWASCRSSLEAGSPMDAWNPSSRKYQRPGVKPAEHWRPEESRGLTRRSLRFRTSTASVRKHVSWKYLFPYASCPMPLQLREEDSAVTQSTLPRRRG